MGENKPEDLIYSDDWEEEVMTEQDDDELMEEESINDESRDLKDKNGQDDEDDPMEEDYSGEPDPDGEDHEWSDLRTIDKVIENEQIPIIKFSRSTRISPELIYKPEREELAPVKEKDKLKE